MTGFDFVVDTNFLIDVHEGRDKVEPFLDAIIAATSKYLQIPLVTSDKGFKNIPDIELILI